MPLIALMIRSLNWLMIRLLMRDTHSPPQIRVNGVLSNFTPFYKTFNVKSLISYTWTLINELLFGNRYIHKLTQTLKASRDK